MSEENVIDPVEVIVPVNQEALLRRKIEQLENRLDKLEESATLTRVTSDLTKLLVDFEKFVNDINGWRQHIVMGINANAQEYGVRLLVMETILVGEDDLSKEIRSYIQQGSPVPMEKLSKLVETVIIPQLQEQFQQTAQAAAEATVEAQKDNVIQLTDFQK